MALPPRCLDELSLWVRHMHNARVLSPPQLVEKHHQAANALVLQYLRQNQDI